MNSWQPRHGLGRTLLGCKPATLRSFVTTKASWQQGYQDGFSGRPSRPIEVPDELARASGFIEGTTVRNDRRCVARQASTLAHPPEILTSAKTCCAPAATRPSVPEPRHHLLRAVLSFVRAARSAPGVHGIALLGSLATAKPVPKDADVLVTIEADIDLSSLARISRASKGPRKR